MAEIVSRLSGALADRYAIEREIGQGGMATVYLARDVRHARQVALKVLNPELGALLGVDRFLAEIRVTANLQHPNLLPLFDSGEADGLLFYVMPYVEGESLRQRIDREKQLPIDDALRIGTAVAMALDYAHRHGVIHRDLKPENILLHDGQPLVADFGIALAVSVAGGNRITQTGLSLGTPQYMSPEQATGDRSIDGRTDIYSLGAVLYEMFTGDPPHTGSTSQAIIARVLTEKPRSVRSSRPNVALQVEHAVARALEKLPADRFASARAFADALSGAAPADSRTSAEPRDRLTIRLPASRVRSTTKWLGLALLVGAATWGWLRPRPAREPVSRVRFALAPTDSTPLREDIPGANLALSPDGTQLVFLAGLPTSRLYLRGFNDLEAREIPGTERAVTPRFSPDGRWLAFVVDGQLKKIPLAGGPAVRIADGLGPDATARYSWGDQDVVVFRPVPGRGLYSVTAAGGAPTPLTVPDTTRHENVNGHTWPEVLPGGRAVVFTISSDTGALDPELAAVRFSDGRVVHLGVRGWNPRYVATGHILFSRIETGSVSAVPFDVERLRVTGPPVTVLEGVVVRAGGAAQIAVSPTGTLVFVQVTGSQLVRVSRNGAARQILSGPGRYETPRASPTGDRFALIIREASGAANVWVHNPALGTLARLTNDGNSIGAAWTGDGKRIAWGRGSAGPEGGQEIRWQPWDGSDSAETLAAANKRFRTVDFPASGKLFVSEGPSGVWVTDTDRSSTARLIAIPSIGGQPQPAVSPDGRWLAYRSIQSGVGEVYVTSLSGGGRYQVSENGGVEPAWSADGRTLFYRAPGRFMAASISTTSEFSVLRRDSLFADVYLRGVGQTNYDVVANGSEFLMVRRGLDQQRIVIVLGWLDELRERMSQAAAR
jgi:eukaryotic-like serine/threonine-protein kinase